MKLFRVLDPFTLTLVCTVLLATFFPARGGFVPFFERADHRSHCVAVFYAWRETVSRSDYCRG